MIDLVVVLVVLASLAMSALRRLRVAQREHYVPGRVRAIERLWLSRSIRDVVLGLVAAVLAAVACVLPSWQGAGTWATLLALPAALIAAVLAWTHRLRRLAMGWAVGVLALGAGLWWLAGAGATALLAVTVPATMDAALWLMERVERRLSAPFVARAQRRLARVRPQVVAVTGSYGKTSTKGYIAHLLATSRSVVASPSSFNNRLGLSRAVNDHLVDGTEVFVAEMGAFGPGEIRELCELFPPDIAVITTVGEAHLERMGTHERILAAKSEITEHARTVVLPVDTPELAGLADRCEAAGKRVVRCSVVSSGGAAAAGADVVGDVVGDVVVDPAAGQIRVRTGGDTSVGGAALVTLDIGEAVPHPVNLAVSVGVALALDVEPASLVSRLHGLPRAAHRAEVHAGAGVAVIDDTYNANPIGAEAALVEAAELAIQRGGPLVVVTPGIVELGHVQRERNAAFARSAAQAGAHLVVVGRTNRAALVAGARQGGGTPDVVDRREQAVRLATSVAGERGVVLYENDLPDHYPCSCRGRRPPVDRGSPDQPPTNEVMMSERW